MGALSLSQLIDLVVGGLAIGCVYSLIESVVLSAADDYDPAPHVSIDILLTIGSLNLRPGREFDAGGMRSLNFQFRLEAMNVFNIANLNNPGTTLTAPATFGKIRSARNMRQIQLGARVSF